MRSDRRRQEEMEREEGRRRRRQETSGLAKFTKVFGILFLIITLLFGGILAFSNLLVPKYLLIVGLVLALFCVILLPPLLTKNTKKAPKILSVIIALLLMLVYLVGIRYLLGALGFMSKITDIGAYTDYYVVVRDDDVYNDINDIEGETVYAYQNGRNFEDAVSELEGLVNVAVQNTVNLEALSSQLLTGDIDVIFLNAGVYDGLCEDIESFDDYTKILHTIRVRGILENIRKPVTVTTEPFNIYITGIDTRGTVDVVARSDVNMIVTVNPSTRTILMTSIPRDYYVYLPDADAYDKLTHTGIYGADYTVSVVENLLGLDMNYYVKVNFSTLELLVDAIGGIEVYSDYSFTAREGGFYYEEGLNYMDGEEALAFARERYSFEDGDFQRNKNQQLVLKAIIDKVSQSSTIMTRFMSILGSLEDNIETNMDASELKSLVRMQTADMSGWNVESQNIVGATGSAPCYSLGNIEASVVFQNEEANAAAVYGIQSVMER